MSNTIICGMDAHDNTLSNRIGVDRETPETKTVKNTRDGRQKLIKYLKKLGLYRDTLIIFNADHGESFGEHNYFKHGRKLYNSCLHVPLIIKLPQNQKKKPQNQKKRKRNLKEWQRRAKTLSSSAENQ